VTAMDTTLLGITISAIIVLGLFSIFIFKNANQQDINTLTANHSVYYTANNDDEAPHTLAGRDDGLSRMRRLHRSAIETEDESIEDDDDTQLSENENQSTRYPQKKSSKKKAEKLKFKEQAREARLAQQERKRAEEKTREGEESLLKEKEKEEERILEEELTKVRAEREKKEEEEYKKWKFEISVEESGTDELDDAAKATQGALFIDTIKKKKVMRLEDIAIEFKMRTPDVIAYIKELDSKKVLSGVIDDRGKFIFITKEEFDAVAKFIVRKGRVSIHDIASESNRLIKLEETE